MNKIDPYDRILLTVLQANGKASNVELSDKVELSAPQCYRRVRRLEAENIIRGYSIHLDPSAIGLTVTAYVSVQTDRRQSEQLKMFEEAVRQFPEVIECHTVSGEADYLLKVVAADLPAFSQFLNSRLSQVPGVLVVRSMICLAEVKQASPLPISEIASSSGG